MAFPRSPTTGDLHTIDQSTWRWTGYAWRRVRSYVSSWNGQTGDIVFTDYISSWNGQTGDIKYTPHDYTGILHGGILNGTIGGTTFNVSAGIGQIVGYTASISGITSNAVTVTWDDYSNVAITNLATNDFTRVYIDSNGDLIQQTSEFTHEDYNNKIIIGTISHIDQATIALVTNKQFTPYQIPHKVYELYDTFGPIKKSGLLVSPNGTNLSLNRSAGDALVIGGNYPANQFEPDDVDIAAKTLASIARIYRDGSGDWIYDTNNLLFYSVVNPAQYDNGTGTLATVNNNQYTIQRMYMFPNLPDVIMLYYGRIIYNSYSDASAGVQDEVFTEAPITALNAVFLGHLIVRGGASNLSSTSDAKILQSGFCRLVGGGGGGGGGAAALGDLTDVTLSGVTAADILYYEGTEWINKSIYQIGVTGPTGPAGATGVTGADGATGPSGSDADATAIVWMFGA